MKNIKEKLEIMQWLYELGIEPRMLHDSREGSWRVYKDHYGIKSSNEQILAGNHSYKYDPWHPLEQVLELLQCRIRAMGSDYIERGFGDDINCKSIPYLVLNQTKLAIVDHFKNMVIEEEYLEDDPHLAALKLLKRVIEKYPESIG